MDLILWRHAEAEDWHEGCNDLERSLTTRGEKQATRMAVWLDRQLPDGARILCSPARRTEQTALALGRKFKMREELGPKGSFQELLELARWPEGKSTVLIVGHQPTLGQTIAALMRMETSDNSVRKGAVWWMRGRERDGALQTTLVCVQQPEML
jgi:phosphohistidine phosphatase